MSEFRLGLMMVITLIGMFGFLFATKYINYKPDSNQKIEQHSMFSNSGMVNTLMAGEQKPANKNSLTEKNTKNSNSSAATTKINNTANNNIQTWQQQELTPTSESANVNPFQMESPKTEIQSFEEVTAKSSPAVPIKDENPLDLWGKPEAATVKVVSSKSEETPNSPQDPWNVPANPVSSSEPNPAAVSLGNNTPTNPFSEQPATMNIAESSRTTETQLQTHSSSKSNQTVNPFAGEVSIPDNQVSMVNPEPQTKKIATTEAKTEDLWGPPITISEGNSSQVASNPQLSPQPLNFADAPAAMPEAFNPNPLPEPRMTLTSPVDINSTKQPTPKLAASNPPELKLLAVHEVQSGENYWIIAKRYYEAGKYGVALEEYNKSRIPDPKKIRPGMKVLVPQLSELELKMPQLAPVMKKEEAPLPVGLFHDGNGHPMYRVGENDTLSKIAQEHLGRATRWTEIQQLNPDLLKDLNQMKPGMVIKLPQNASSAKIASENDDFFR